MDRRFKSRLHINHPIAGVPNFDSYRMVLPSYKLVYKPHEYYSCIYHKP